MSSEKQKRQPKQGPPVAFRPGPDLEPLVRALAGDHRLGINEACKSLVALAVTAMDVRYYALIQSLAGAMGGANAFVRACVHVQGRVAGATSVRRELLLEPARSLYIVNVVTEFLQSKGRQLPELDLSFLPERGVQHARVEETESSRKKTSTARPKPSIRPLPDDDDEREADRPRQRQ